MKSITEFSHAALQKVSAAKAALVAAGKTAEELAAGLGESLKLEGDKLKFAMAAADLVADKKSVRRVVVVSFAEGEVAPAKYQQVEDTHYLVEVLEAPKAPAAAAPAGKGGRQGGGFKKDNKSSGPKSSPWGASPEEIEAKKKASLAAKAAAKASAPAAAPAKKK